MNASTPMRLLTVALSVGAAAVFLPFWAPLVLAAWFADLLSPAATALERRLGGRSAAAGALIVLVVLAALIPVVALVAAVLHSTGELFDQVRSAFDEQRSVAPVLLGGAPPLGTPIAFNWNTLASRYGASAWSAGVVLGRASASAVVSALVFVVALYTFIREGRRAEAWLADHAPLPHGSWIRLAAAFRETGRGLMVGAGGTSLVQGLLATCAYVALGIPRALVLGPLTAVCAIIPVAGTGLVWLPLAIGFGLAGEYGRCVALLVMGVAVSLIDNVVRPFFTRFGQLQLSTFVVLVSMLGGVALFGGTGALLGPLLVRLCVEALTLTREQRRNR